MQMSSCHYWTEGETHGTVLFYPLLTTFRFSGSASLAQVTPLFLAVTGFLSFRAVQHSRY